jgi:hypothetical protein
MGKVDYRTVENYVIGSLLYKVAEELSPDIPLLDIDNLK